MKTFRDEANSKLELAEQGANMQDLKPVTRLIGNDFLGHLKNKT